MAAPPVVHELIDRAWDDQADVGLPVKIYRIAQVGERYLAETHGGLRRIATPDIGPHAAHPAGWEISERAPSPWRNAKMG